MIETNLVIFLKFITPKSKHEDDKVDDHNVTSSCCEIVLFEVFEAHVCNEWCTICI